jgi:hypothetical protein
MRSAEMNAELRGGGFKHLLFVTTGNPICTGGNVVSLTVISITSCLCVFVVDSASIDA